MKQFARTLKHKITILSKNPNSDDWESVKECFVFIKDLAEESLSLYENTDFGILISKNYKVMRTRFLKDISKNMRIRFEGHIYEIIKIIDEKNQKKIAQILVSQI